MRRETIGRFRLRGHWWLLVAVTLLLLGAPQTASATDPAQDQYSLPAPSATGSGGGGNSHGRLDSPVATTGSGLSGGTVAILVGGLTVIGAGAAIVIYRRRQRGLESSR
jgi:hypothetical protein